MLRELNVAEQRYRAVVEVLSGTPVIEVAGHITVGDGIAVTAPRKTSRDIGFWGLDGNALPSHTEGWIRVSPH